MTRQVVLFGTKYDLDDLRREWLEDWATRTAEVWLLLPGESCVDRGRDLNKAEASKQDNLLSELREVLPEDVSTSYTMAFEALFLPRCFFVLAESARSGYPICFNLLFNAFHTLTLPPERSPYFRTFLRDPIATSVLADIFMQMIVYEPDEEFEPIWSHVLVTRILYFGAPLPLSEGGDGHAPFLPSRRQDYIQAREEALKYLPQRSNGRKAVFRHLGLLKSIDATPRYLRSARDEYLALGNGSVPRADGPGLGCEVDGCTGATVGVCARCQCARYCSRECQRADWDARHRIRCFKTNFRFMDPAMSGWTDDAAGRAARRRFLGLTVNSFFTPETLAAAGVLPI